VKLYIKSFNELSNKELYDILKLRVDVFVVEQNCPYPDLDNLDLDAIHIYLADENKIQAYLRLMDRGVESEHVSIGRVIAGKRKRGLGRRIMEEGIKAAKEIFDAEIIYLEAQAYARGFYEKLGFKQVSEEFLLDDIPHVKMELKVD
jgi:ElaA protein